MCCGLESWVSTGRDTWKFQLEAETKENISNGTGKLWAWQIQTAKTLAATEEGPAKCLEQWKAGAILETLLWLGSRGVIHAVVICTDGGCLKGRLEQLGNIRVWVSFNHTPFLYPWISHRSKRWCRDCCRKYLQAILCAGRWLLLHGESC